MKIPAALLALLFFPIGALEARENPYDTFGKMLGPFVNLFAKEATDKAMVVDLSLVEMTGLPAEYAGTRLRLAIETPDKIYLRAPVLGEETTVCRNRQEIWASPGAKIEALLSALPEEPRKKYKLGRLELPIPQKQLVFFPALFQVREVGEQKVNGELCRVLDVTLMPELVKSLKIEAWSARAWVRADHKPARITFAKPQWHFAVDFTNLEYSPSLPPETWEPSAEQKEDVTRLDAQHFKQLLDAAARAFKLSNGD